MKARSPLWKTGTLLTALSLVAPASSALTFNFTDAGGVAAGSAAALGFQAAADLWSSLFTDDVTVNIEVGFTDLGAGILGQSSSTHALVSYDSFRNALTADQTSVFDAAAVSNLPTGSSVPLWVNYTANNPNGSGGAASYLDNDGDDNNSWINLTAANAKALGFNVGSGLDARISFSTAFNWDFDDSDGISSSYFDFIGIAAHEMGHALGFISGVDILDINSPNGTTYYDDDEFIFVSTLDLFRYSTESLAQDALDWSADKRDKYFSIDGGNTPLASFATGKTHGDGRQASHWKDKQGLGLMDPTAAPGEYLQITDYDLLAFDVIGWDLNLEPIPAPGSLALMLAGVAGIGGSLRRRPERSR
ncbi:PEP-CTERM motif protein [Thiocystis violascens DSM 198]|uniref:PEP-CTERM motif protein n=2 Tax=Thiocystis violascens TaxID=73141 RepID=I3YD48_THIV6|nr:PEP-CTERM motif protein [Thiocystis violascens DSM 198]